MIGLNQLLMGLHDFISRTRKFFLPLVYSLLGTYQHFISFPLSLSLCLSCQVIGRVHASYRSSNARIKV